MTCWGVIFIPTTVLGKPHVLSAEDRVMERKVSLIIKGKTPVINDVHAPVTHHIRVITWVVANYYT